MLDNWIYGPDAFFSPIFSTVDTFGNKENKKCTLISF